MTTGSIAVRSLPLSSLQLTEPLQATSQGGSSMAYAVTKAAQLQLIRCLGVTQGPKIRINTVLPGLLLTEWVRGLFSRPSSAYFVEDANMVVGPALLRRDYQYDQGEGTAQA